MKSKTTDYVMGEMPYKKAIWKLALPAIGTFLVLSFYLTVDRILISRIVGPEGLGALQYVGPALNMLAGITIVVGVGAKIRFSILLGQKRLNDVKQLIANAIVLMFLVGLVLTFVLYNFGRKIPILFGADPVLAKMASHYFYLLSFGILAQSMVFLFESLFQAKGYTKPIMWFTAIAQITNLILDIVFMKYMNMGIAGAALATMTSMYVDLLLFLGFILFFKREFLVNPFVNSFKKHTNKKILKLGSPSLFSNFILSIKIAFFTYLLSKTGGKEEIITYAAARTVIPILLIPAFGLLSATGPMIGYNFGARQYKRMKDVVSYKFRIMISYFFITSLIIFVFPKPIMNIFNAGNYAMSTFIPRSIIATLWMFAYPLTWTSIFQSTGNPKDAIAINLARHIFIFIPIVYVASTFNDVKLLILALPLSDIIGIIFTKIYVTNKLKKTNAEHLLQFK